MCYTINNLLSLGAFCALFSLQRYGNALRDSICKEVNSVKDIHPKYEKAVIRCACGNVIETRSTKENISVEVCSKCHPFFTGKQKLVDTGGRVDRFNKRFGRGK